MIPKNVKIVDYTGKILCNYKIKSRIEELRNLIVKNRELKDMRKDDNFLLRYLHQSNFNIEKSHLKITKFYHLLKDYPDWFKFDCPKTHQDLLSRNMRILLNKRDKQGRCIFIFKLGNIDTSKVTAKDASIVDNILLETALEDPLTQRKGFCAILDVAGYSLSLLSWLTPPNIQYSVKKLDALPMKDIQIHIVNNNILLEPTLKIIFPYLKPMLKDIIFHNTGWETLYQYIRPEVLPPEYGGTSTETYEAMNKLILEKNEEFIQNTNYIKKIIS